MNYHTLLLCLSTCATSYLAADCAPCAIEDFSGAKTGKDRRAVTAHADQANAQACINSGFRCENADDGYSKVWGGCKDGCLQCDCSD